MSDRAYISGPMTGIKKLNYPAFERAAHRLKKKGFIVIDPTRHPMGLSYEEYMAYAMLDVAHADCLFLLHGWQNSKGAVREVERARELGKDIIPYMPCTSVN